MSSWALFKQRLHCRLLGKAWRAAYSSSTNDPEQRPHSGPSPLKKGPSIRTAKPPAPYTYTPTRVVEDTEGLWFSDLEVDKKRGDEVDKRVTDNDDGGPTYEEQSVLTKHGLQLGDLRRMNKDDVRLDDLTDANVDSKADALVRQFKPTTRQEGDEGESRGDVDIRTANYSINFGPQHPAAHGVLRYNHPVNHLMVPER
jgi:hypothetical protein